MNSIERLAGFIIDNNGGQPVDLGIIENWFRMIAQAVILSKGEPITPDESFRVLSEGMAARYYQEGITNPKLLDAIRENLADYMKEQPEAAYQPIRAGSLIRPNTLLANSLSDLINKGEVQIATGRKAAKEPLTETVIVAMDPREGVKIEGNYDLFHEAVFCAILSLYRAGNNIITPYMVRRFLAQDYRTKRIKPPTIEAITNAIEDLRRLHVKVDISDEVERGRKIKKGGPTYYGGFMLEMRDVETQIGGEKVKGYLITMPPILYEHAERLGQIQTFPAKLLAITDPETGERIRTTEARTSIQLYLLKQISNIKNDLETARKELRNYESKRAKNPAMYPAKPLSYFRKMNGKILFQTLFEKTSLSGKQNKTLIEYRKYIYICLDNWGPDGEKLIKGYKILKEGRRKDVETGVEILID